MCKYYTIFFFFLATLCMACGILVPDQGSNLGPHTESIKS